jgi:nitrilase
MVKNLVAAIQMTSGMNVSQNLAQAQHLLEQAAQQGAVLAVLPEMFVLRGAQGDALKQARIEIAETIGHGPIQDFLAKIAKRLNLWIVAGTMPIKSSDLTRSFAACLVFNAQGEQVARYDKIHLFDVKLSHQEIYQESDSTVPGNSIVVVQTPVGKLGLSVCYDIRFPDLYRELISQGAQILAVPSAFTRTTGQMHWEVLTRALAIQQFCYVIAAGQYGPNTYGHSMIIAPDGEILAQLPEGPGIILAGIDLEKLVDYRKSIPVLKH